MSMVFQNGGADPYAIATAAGTVGAVLVALGFGIRDSYQRRKEAKRKAELAFTLLLPHFHTCRGALAEARADRMKTPSVLLAPKIAHALRQDAADLLSGTAAMERFAFDLDADLSKRVTAVIALCRQTAWQINRSLDDSKWSGAIHMVLATQIHHAATQAFDILEPLCKEAESFVVGITKRPFWTIDSDD